MLYIILIVFSSTSGPSTGHELHKFADRESAFEYYQTQKELDTSKYISVTLDSIKINVNTITDRETGLEKQVIGF